MSDRTPLADSLQAFSGGAALLLAVMGAVVLTGWALDFATLKNIAPGLATMKVNTAFAFLLSGASLWRLQEKRAGRYVNVAKAFALAVAVIGLLSLFENGLGWDLGIDQLLVRDSSPAGPTSAPGRMAFVTALNFLLLGLALLLLDAPRNAADYPTAAAGSVSLIAVLGYAYDIRALYSVGPFGSVALHTAIGFVVLSGGILTARPERGLTALLTNIRPGGTLMRTLLLPAVVTPIVLGWLCLLGQRAGLYGTEFGVALFAVSNILVFLGLAAWTGRSLDKSDAERRQAESAQRRSEGRMKSVLDAALDAVVGMDAQGLVISWNPRAADIFGWSGSEAVGRRLADLIIPPRYREAHTEGLARFLATGEGSVIGRRIELSALRRNGTEFPVELTITVLREGDALFFNAFVADITERKHLETQLLQSQKIESVGRLAGGVAHDFNNLLGVITGYGELLNKRMPDEPQLKRYVSDILKAADRAAGLTRQLLAFSRKQVLQPLVLDLNTVVGEMEKMLRRLIGEDVQLVTVFADRLQPVQADPGQIEQVLMNLAVNARDAMPRGGRLTIETANVDLDVAYARSRPGVKPGLHVMLAVSDTGHGMDPEVMGHIFEPFFTTKEAGKGTGLGLATVHGIVKQSGGHLFVYSEPGHGTTFKVYLPCLEDAETGVETPTVPEAGPQRGSEAILLVEDEESLRSIVREILEASGYTVMEARHAGHALEIAEEHRTPIHLLMTDVVMPGMSGSELAVRLAASHAETRVLYMSGYTDDAVVLHGVLAADVAFLQKPFTAEALAKKVREVLDR
ncbi:MAG TPA: PAS domain S-box protein [Vicinamibacteria bacterium]|nr:PAS domain S-box protein [Vicinamibacteria bacterium]